MVTIKKKLTRLLGALSLVFATLCLISPKEAGTRFLQENEGPKLPLKYPFFICQFGRPRSATTFQTRLLLAIANLKSPEGTTFPQIPSLPIVSEMSSTPISIVPGVSVTDSGIPAGVMKTHAPKIGLECVERGYPVFTSDRPDDAIGDKWDNKFKAALHRQDMVEMEKCSLCQVDYYKPIFDLSDDEVSLLKEYMGLYEKIRQCCGMQMSKYNRARLHGCDISELRNLPHYPNCEENNMKEIEEMLYNHPIKVEPADPAQNWSKPGDCEKFDELIISGNDFNKKKWDEKCPVVENKVVTYHI